MIMIMHLYIFIDLWKRFLVESYHLKLSPARNCPNIARSMSQIEITNLSFTYLGREEPTLNGISIAVEQGDFILLTG